MARRKQEQMERLRGAFGFADDVRLGKGGGLLGDCRAHHMPLMCGGSCMACLLPTPLAALVVSCSPPGIPTSPLTPHNPLTRPAQVKEGDAFNRELQEQKRLERIAEREAQEKERK